MSPNDTWTSPNDDGALDEEPCLPVDGRPIATPRCSAQVHPYTSFLPIFLYLVLRNMTADSDAAPPRTK